MGKTISTAVLFLVFTVIFILLTGCTSTPPQTKTNTVSHSIEIPTAKIVHFGKPIKIESIASVYQLSSKQRSEFLDYFNNRSVQHISSNKRVYKYLERYVTNYNFLNQTLTASDSLSLSKGNCLSLAILTTAFAHLAEVEINYQLVDSAPVYQKEGEMILSSQHIRSMLLEPKEKLSDGLISFGRNGILVDYFPAVGTKIRRNVSANEFAAMYYRNKAAEAIIRERYNSAFWLLKHTLSYLPKDEHAINMMALVHEKKNLMAHAERIFQFGIKHSNHKLELLRNYYLFLKKENRLADARKIKSQLNRFEVENPFDWINLGHFAFSENKFRDARSYFKKAIKIAPYLHQAYMGLAKSEFKLGNLRLSRDSFELAKQHAFDHKQKQLYQAKLSMLSKI